MQMKSEPANERYRSAQLCLGRGPTVTLDQFSPGRRLRNAPKAELGAPMRSRLLASCRSFFGASTLLTSAATGFIVELTACQRSVPETTLRQAENSGRKYQS